MNTNEAPEKIYITPNIDRKWQTEAIDDESIEYTRTDAFIEKTVTFIKERLNFADNAWYIEGEVTVKDKVIEDFKNYMEGEKV